MQTDKINIFWFRRDLRLEDNTALAAALNSGLPVLPVYIFDTGIISNFRRSDPRVTFIYETLSSINEELRKYESCLYVKTGTPERTWSEIITLFSIESVFANKEYEPFAIERDRKISEILAKNGIRFQRFKDQVIFEEKELTNSAGNPFTIFTPYARRWMSEFNSRRSELAGNNKPDKTRFLKFSCRFPGIKDTGFVLSGDKIRTYDLSCIPEYDKYRDFPALDRTTYLGPHLRFGTVSIRQIVSVAYEQNIVFLNELIWRDFFMQIIFNFPDVVTGNFRRKYDNVNWRNNEEDFARWSAGETGYPIVDAGMRQLNETGYMHNRVRMITAGFLCKHLLTDWRIGEAYFAERLNDYDLSSNNGNWQWAAGTGCDAAPFFRIFNPHIQQKKYDPGDVYVRRWVRDLGKKTYPQPVIDHETARERALATYRSDLSMLK